MASAQDQRITHVIALRWQGNSLPRLRTVAPDLYRLRDSPLDISPEEISLISS